jgi:uncharacterized protein (DUF302 family)
MKKTILGIVFGFALGLVFAGVLMPKLMVKEELSPMGYEETIAHIQKKVTDGGWKVSALMQLDQTLAKEGMDVLPVASFKICQPDHAEQILLDDDARFLSVMMPCSIAVYEKTDGKTYISTMNTKLLGRMFGGTVAEVMAGPVARETATFIQFD